MFLFDIFKGNFRCGICHLIMFSLLHISLLDLRRSLYFTFTLSNLLLFASTLTQAQETSCTLLDFPWLTIMCVYLHQEFPRVWGKHLHKPYIITFNSCLILMKCTESRTFLERTEFAWGSGSRLVAERMIRNTSSAMTPEAAVHRLTSGLLLTNFRVHIVGSSYWGHKLVISISQN